ncbi:hypothetical protein BJY26_001050 [Spelaeicoccus albus]|uniref:Uncharacterized protein n=1 Tax=Spelaeicoccus albus TaxID=1280376 RepID=A0A7Z0CZZ3_9MICO|nr:hypothetical protein [Spelaeicoccus albus]
MANLIEAKPRTREHLEQGEDPEQRAIVRPSRMIVRTIALVLQATPLTV